MKKFSIKKPFFRLFLFSAFFIFLTFFFLMVFLQSPLGKTYVKNELEKLAKSQGISIEIGQTAVPYPLGVDLFALRIYINPEVTLEMDQVKVKFSLWPLLFFKKLVFSSVYIHDIKVLKIANTTNSPSLSKEFVLPYSLHIRSLRVDSCHMPSGQSFQLLGAMKASRNLQKLFLKISAKKNEAKEFLTWNMQILGNAYDDIFICKSSSQGTTKEAGYSLLQDQNIAWDLHAKAKGRYHEFSRFIFDPSSSFNLQGKAKGSLKLLSSQKFFPKNSLVSCSFFINGQKDWGFTKFLLNNSMLTVEGSGHFLQKTNLDQLDLAFFFRSKDLFGACEGKLIGRGGLKEAPKIELSLASENLRFSSLSLSEVKGLFQGYYDGGPMGQFTLRAKTLSEPLVLSFDVQKSEKNLANLSKINLKTTSCTLTGGFDISKHLGLIGKMDVSVKNFPFSKFPDFFPSYLSFDEGNFQLMFEEVFFHHHFSKIFHVEAHLSSLHFKNFSASNATIFGSVRDFYTYPKYQLIFLAKKGLFENIPIHEIEGKTSNFEESKNPFELYVKGDLKDPFFFTCQGTWSLENPHENELEVTSLYGSLFKENIVSKSPLIFTWSKNHYALQDFELLYGGAPFSGHFLYSDCALSLSMASEKLPLDFCALFQNPNLAQTKGFAKLNAALTINQNYRNGSLNIEVLDLTAYPKQKKKPYTIAGNIQASLLDDQLSFNSDLKYQNAKELQLNGSLPLEISLMPLKVSIHPKKSLSGQCNFEGRIEEILDFFNTGSHEIEGALTCQCTLGGTLFAPHFEGKASFRGGKYENYLTGTSLRDLEGYFKLEKDHVTIERFLGKDRSSGRFKATGNMECLLKKNCPFFLELQLQNLLCVQSDPISAAVRGKVNIQGSLTEAKVKGDLILSEGELAIPEKIPDPLVDFPLTFYPQKNEVKSLDLSEKQRPYPLLLDLSIKIPKNLRIAGRGISSFWEGTLSLKGTFDDLIPKGTVNLVKGDFVFSGHTFELTKGELTFTGEKDLAHFFLEGKSVIQGVNISASLTGPLLSPILTFSSTPPLGASSILALILFGQDISELNALQAVQLASSVASSSSQNIFEATRKKLGIDRLTVVSIPTKNVDDPERMAIQIGKYITKGVLVTFSQGMEQESSNIIVEVDLGKGFVLQAETQQEEEQGKFSLKWNLSY